MLALKRFAGYLAGNEIWPVAFFIGASMAWPPLLPAALGVAASFWVIRWLAYSRLSIRTPIDWPVVLLVLMCLVTLSITALPEITQPQVFRMLSGVALFYAIANWGNTLNRLRICVIGTILTGLILVLMAPFSVQWVSGKIALLPQSIYKHFSIFVADTVHPNVLAGSLLILFPIVFGWLIFDWTHSRWLIRIGQSLTTLLMLAVLVLTESRGALMATGVVIALMIILRWRWSWICVFAVGLASAFYVYRIGTQRFVDMLASGTTVGGIDGRLEIWSRAIYMIQDFPFTGIGMGSFGRVADAIYPFFIYSAGSISHAHNIFLQVAVDLGIPGFIAWVAILITIIIVSWRVYRAGRSIKSGWLAGLGAGLLCSQFALILHGLFDAVTWGMVRTAPIVWAIWGIAMVAYTLQVNKPSEQLLELAPFADERDGQDG